MRATIIGMLIFSTLAGLAGCARGNAEPEPLAALSAPAGLEGKWHASALRGDQGAPWLALDAGEVRGHAGCNTLGGSYSIASGGGITFGPITTSKKLCAGDAMQSEHRVLEALGRTRAVTIEGDRLQLRDSASVLMELQRER